ncbi:hypothetical protein [Nannocystis bainbridge]|uniref:Uncharacterized protein n=1 Tax=Nannocystis bainbridge TaxID=2995303 RepID=A0ABT5DZE3_9BACT|nr:hypothetical protein [Nannocystis bainbridge]MDC0717826.1 hypothetical protein [Nannocystis bainbridge]
MLFRRVSWSSSPCANAEIRSVHRSFIGRVYVLLVVMTALLFERGQFLATPYPSASRELAAGFEAADADEAVEDDDVPPTAHQVAALRDALAAVASARFADAAGMFAAFAAAEPGAPEAGWPRSLRSAGVRCARRSGRRR